jgi:dihydroorotate dehydrogenase electron transfer subunit
MSRTPVPTKIVEVTNEAEKIKTFYLQNTKIAKKSKPGNFVLVWTPFALDGNTNRTPNLDPLDQVPMSVSFADPLKGIFGITVKKIGKTTIELHKYQSGQYLGLMGPLGNSFREDFDTSILLGGGIGVAPLRFLASHLADKNKKIIAFTGFRTKKEIIFLDELKSKVQKLVVATDDGTFGEKSFITTVFEKKLIDLIQSGEIDPSKTITYACGPEVMIRRVMEVCEHQRITLEASLERYVHCGMGICGFCSINGYRVCKDGPIFSSTQLANIKDLGRFRRTSSGKRVKV